MQPNLTANPVQAEVPNAKLQVAHTSVCALDGRIPDGLSPSSINISRSGSHSRRVINVPCMLMQIHTR
jgi:hypothetical protein